MRRKHSTVAEDAMKDRDSNNRLVIKIDTENAAFDGDQLADECSRILRAIADSIDAGNIGMFRTILDANGNDVGRWRLYREDDRHVQIVKYVDGSKI